MNRIIEKISNLLVDRRIFFLAGMIALTLVLSIFLKDIKIENSLNVWFLEDDPTLQNYNEFKEIYGNDEVVCVWLKPDKGIYDKDFIKRIYEASIKLEDHELVRRVISVTNAPYVSGKGGELIVEDMVNKNPDVSFDPDGLKKRIASNNLWKDLLFNKDSSAVMLFVEPVATGDMDSHRPEILEYVKGTFKGFNYRIAGMGVVYDELNRITMNETSIFSSIAYLILIVALFLFFRKWSILIATTVTIIFSLFLFLGIYGLFGRSFDMVSAIIPTLIIILCLADIIHIFSHYYKTEPGENRLKRNLYYVILPCLFTTITTSCGFLALSSSPMAILKNFGIFAAIGVFVAYFVTMITCTYVLAAAEKRETGAASIDLEVKKDFFDKILVKINSINQGYYRYVVLSGAVFLCLALWGLMKLNVDTYSIDLLVDGNRVKEDSKFIEKDYGFYLPFEIRLKPVSETGVKDPGFLKKLILLQERLEKNHDYERATSLADVVKHLNKVLVDNTDASYKIPDTREAVAQELLLYELDEDNDLRYFVDPDYSEVRLTVRVRMTSSKVFRQYLEDMKKSIDDVFGDEVRVVYGGYVPLYVKLIEYITQSQIKSFSIAFVIIFIMIALLFRSLSVILIGIIPNLLPIFITLGFMGWADINLDIATVTIAAIAIGIAVDDTIHFIFMYKKKIGEGDTVPEAIAHTLATSGKAIILTSVLLIIGYMVLLFASIKSVIFFGLLIGITMLSALLCDLFLLPSILLLLNRGK